MSEFNENEKGDFTDSPGENKEKAFDELREMSEKHKKAGHAGKIIGVVVIALILFSCWYGDKTIKRGRAEAPFGEGLEAMARGFWGQAIDKFAKAIEEDKTYTDAYYLSGVSSYFVYVDHLQNSKTEDLDTILNDMFEHLTKTIKMGSHYPECHIYLALYYHEKGQTDQALEELDKGIKAAEKQWKSSPAEKDRWVEYAQEIKEILISKDESKYLHMATSNMIGFLGGKVAYLDRESLKYMKHGYYYKEDLLLGLQYYQLSQSDIEEAINLTSVILPIPPYPKEIDAAPILFH